MSVSTIFKLGCSFICAGFLTVSDITLTVTIMSHSVFVNCLTKQQQTPHISFILERCKVYRQPCAKAISTCCDTVYVNVYLIGTKSETICLLVLPSVLNAQDKIRACNIKTDSDNSTLQDDA